MKLYVVDELKRVPGVGDATPFPARDFSMLLQLDPDKMAQLGLTVSDVVGGGARAERDESRRAPRREPSPPGTQLTLPITTIGRLQTPEEFDDIVIRARPDGSIMRLRDIGRTVLGARSYDLEGRLNGEPTAFVLIYTRPGANALAVKAAIAEAARRDAVGLSAGRALRRCRSTPRRSSARRFTKWRSRWSRRWCS